LEDWKIDPIQFYNPPILQSANLSIFQFYNLQFVMVTAIIGKDHYKTQLITPGQTLVADEAVDVGGTGLGPGPGEFLLMSLASCTAITLRMYADRKKWPVKKIRVEVGSEKVNNTTVFLRHIYLDGALDEDQRQRMVQIANSCPVHKTLTNPIEIKTELK
jgi:putative redox protein